MGVSLQPPDTSDERMTREAFIIKAIFPKPEILAWLIKMVDSGHITRATAKKLIADHCEFKRKLVIQIVEDAKQKGEL